MLLSILPFILLLISTRVVQATPIPYHQSSGHNQPPPAQPAPSEDLISSILDSILNLGTALVHADSVGGGWNNHLSKYVNHDCEWSPSLLSSISARYKARAEDSIDITEDATGDLSAALDALRTTIMSFGAVAGGAFANRLSRFVLCIRIFPLYLTRYLTDISKEQKVPRLRWKDWTDVLAPQAA